GLERDVPVRDARQRALADDRARALVERTEVAVVDRHDDLGDAVVGEPDVRDLPDRQAADLDLVALDELARVGDARGQAVVVLLAQQDVTAPTDRRHHGKDRGDAHHSPGLQVEPPALATWPALASSNETAGCPATYQTVNQNAPIGTSVQRRLCRRAVSRTAAGRDCTV